MMKALLVDDEVHALNILALFLHKIGDVEIIGSASNAKEALDHIRTQLPDVVFLDIEMPEMNGVELAEVIKNEFADMQIVFITAYDQYAVSAFEREALDYILKPLEMERLEKTVSRIRKEITKNEWTARSAAAETGSLPSSPKLHIRLLGGFEVMDESGNRLKMRTAKEKELLAYLTLHADSRPHRDLILEQLWPDEHYQKAKVYLHTCVSYLRKDMKSFGLDSFVMYENQRYFLNLDRVTVDIHVFKQKLSATKRQTPTPPDEWADILALYTGTMLEETDYLWAERSAEAFDMTVMKLRLSLVKAYLDHAQAEKAAELAERVCEQSPYNEEAYRLLMQSFQMMGDHNGVYRVYRQLEQLLKELQIEPSDMTKSIFNGMKHHDWK